ncbi:MAG: hypothetical protein MJ231_07725, partial [bacterium]|nr:hypothetical protein [bacterium]
MKKNKTLLGLLALGVLSTSMLTGCGNENPSDEPGEVEDHTDQDAADGVIALINALTNTSSESDVVADRTAYNALTAAQKALVTNIVKLEAQEKRVADDKLVKEVVDMIAALTDESTETQVNAAYAKYSNLDDSLKSKVTNLTLLLAQKARIDAKVIVDPVIELINALDNQSTKEEVKAAEAAYLALSDDDKQYVGASVVAKLNAQLQRVLEADIAAAKEFINNVVVEDLISDASIIDVLVDMSELDLSESILDTFSQAQKEKLALLKRTTDSYEYAGTHQAKSWREASWEHDSYGSLSFGAPTLNAELNAEVRPFEVTYYNDGENVHKEFGITLVGDSNLKDSKKQAVFHLYNPDIDTNLRIDYAKGTDGTFCDGGTIALKHGWNRVEVSLTDVSDKNVVNLMVGILNNEGGVTETSGWMISSFIKYDDSVSGAIRTEYYRIAKILNTYLNKQEATERNEYATVCEEYAKLTAEEKAMLPEGVATKIAADELAFKVADAEALNELLGQIPAITDQTDLVKYAGEYLVKLSEYKLQYEAFDAGQKALVTNANILQGLDSLSSFGVLSFGDKQITGWSDYGTFPSSVTDTEAGY